MITYRTYKNPNAEEYAEIVEAVKANDGYCPCLTTKNEDTKCMCKDFRELECSDFCHCGRFYKVAQFETLALIGDITDTSEYFEQWEGLLTRQNFIVLPVTFNANNIYHHGPNYENICKAKIHKADAVFILDDETEWLLDMEMWATTIGKRVLRRRDLKNEN